MDELLYWIIEYGKVLLGYGFLMFVWPLVVFRKYLSGKSLTFRFSFCVTMQVVLVNTVVLFLGLLHILNDWTVRILFYGTFLFSIRECFRLTPERKKKIKYLFNGTYGWKNFIWFKWRKTMRTLEEFCKRLLKIYKRNWLLYSLLIVLILYGMIYFSWGLFHDRSYGFSDMYVHHSWIYQLSEGKPFFAGIYPEGMHCVVYALNALFGIRLYSCMMFLAAANIVLILLSICCLLKELFEWQYSAVFVLVILLTFGDIGRYIIISMARLQCALPQEFAFPAVFICCLYLIKYLKSCNYSVFRGKTTKGYWDENLLIFVLALASTIVVHFYATFMAFFLCVGVAIFYWKRIFTRQRFLPLVTAAILGVVISVVPMVAGFATGIPLQGSLYWAMGVMQNSSSEDDVNVDDSDDAPEVIPGESESMPTQPESTDIVYETTARQDEGDTAIPHKEKTSFTANIINKVSGIILKICGKFKNICSTVYEKTYLDLYDAALIKIVLFIMLAVLAGGILGVAVISVIGKVRHKEIKRPAYAGYFVIIFMSLVYALAYTSDYIGIPKLIDRSRLCFIFHLLMVMVAVIPLDMILRAGKRLISVKILQPVSVLITGGLAACIYVFGFYHGYLYYELTRYDAAVQVTNKIVDELPKESFTIVSPTEELYQTIEFGWHEELLTFLEGQYQESYTLPTEYVFIFVEKKPLRHAQYHFFDGPKWLANDRYLEIYGTYSVWPEYRAAEISEEDADKGLMFFSKLSDSYAQIESRTIIESKAYEWCEEFEKRYPNEFRTYYEDEYFVCYYFRQNVNRVYNLVME